MLLKIRIKYNEENDDLWCNYSKERIQLGDKYIEVTEEYFDEIIVKAYLPEYAPETDEFEGEDEEELFNE